MKIKKQKSALSLNKETVSNLNNLELEGIIGGTADTGSGCTACYDCSAAYTICLMTNSPKCLPTG